MITIKIIPLNNSVYSISKKVVQILNKSQTAFNFDLITDEKLSKSVEEWDYIHTDDLYPKYESLRQRIKGYNPNLLGITNKPLGNKKYQNLFGDLQKHNGISLGNGVITTYNIEAFINEIPIEAYLLYELLLCPLLIIARTNLFHDEKRICPFDRKVLKSEIYEVLKYSTLCISCSAKIRKILDRKQLTSMRNIFPLIGDLSNSILSINEVLESPPIIHEENMSKNIFKQTRELISKSELKKAINNMENHIVSTTNHPIDELLIQKMNLSNLNKSERLGTISIDQLSLEKNKIASSLLNILAEAKTNKNIIQ